MCVVVAHGVVAPCCTWCVCVCVCWCFGTGVGLEGRGHRSSNPTALVFRDTKAVDVGLEERGHRRACFIIAGLFQPRNPAYTSSRIGRIIRPTHTPIEDSGYRV